MSPHSTTYRGESSRARGAPLEGPSQYDGVVCARLLVLSLSRSLSLSRRVFVYLWFYGRNLGQILKDYQR